MNVPAIDLDTIQYLKTLSADPAFLQSLIEAFTRDTALEIPQMKNAYQKRDTTTLQHIAHKYKSSSRNLGASKLTLLCLDVENMVREGEGESPTLAGKIQMIEDEAQRAVQELHALKP